MLSYRHAFHAGNHADVLKHCTLIQILKYFNLKDKPYWFIDTHAGGGLYQLDKGFAQKSAEAETGIMPVWQAKHLPEALNDYRHSIAKFNATEQLRYYPGSPLLAQQFSKREDRLRLFELHPTEIEILKNNLNHQNTQIFQEDGFIGIKKLLPPPTRRALILIDPSYEIKTDYNAVLNCLKESIKRFATGCYVVWYPQVVRPESIHFIDRLKQQYPQNWLHLRLMIKAAPQNKLGLYGSGLFILNPPYILAKQMKESLIWMHQHLAQDQHAQYQLEEATH